MGLGRVYAPLDIIKSIVHYALTDEAWKLLFDSQGQCKVEFLLNFDEIS